MLYEYGHVFPIGLYHLKRIAAVVEDPACDLPALVIAQCRDLLAQIAEKTERIEAKTEELKAMASETDTARRLQTMPGVGPLTALAVEAFAPDMAQFKSGLDFATWKDRVRPTMRQTHVGGEKVFVDFAGDMIDVVDPATGEARAIKLFVAAMGASNYTTPRPWRPRASRTGLRRMSGCSRSR